MRFGIEEKYKILKNKEFIIYCIISVIYGGTSYIFLNMNLLGWESIIAAISLGFIVITFMYFIRLDIGLVSISSIFFILLCIFHLGQVFINGFIANHEFTFKVINVVGEEFYKKAIFFSICTIIALALGICIQGNIKTEEKLRIKKKLNEKYLAYIILILTLPIDIAINLKKVIDSMSVGYVDGLNNTVSGLITQVAQLHIIGICLLILCYSKKKRIANSIYGAYVIYLIVTMGSGGRIYQLISIIIVTYVLINAIKFKLTRKNTAILVLGAIIVAIFLNSIIDFRGLENRNLEALIQIVKENIMNNPIVTLIEELGGTIYTVCLTIIKVPNEIGYSGGEQFITGLATALPNYKGMLSGINEKANFVISLNTPYIGGSFVAETYWSFGYIGILFTFFVGTIIGKISIIMKKYLDEGNNIKVLYFIMPAWSLMLWVRGSYLGIVRNTIWAAIFIWVISKVLYTVSKKKTHCDDNTKKILHIVGKLNTGGAENMAMNFCRYSQKEKFLYEYLVFGNETGEYEKEAIEKGAKVIHIDGIEKGKLKYIKNLTKIIRGGEYNAVHAHLMLNNGISLFIAKMCGVPVRVTHSHSCDFGRTLTKSYKIYIKIMKFFIRIAANRFVACGEEAGNMLYGEGKFSKDGVILKNAINLDKYTYDLDEKKKMKKEYKIEGKTVVGHIGRLTEVKNHKFLIQVFEKMLKKNEQLILMIIGDGELKEDLLEYVEKRQLEEKIIFTGNVSSVEKYLQCVDIIVFPSLYEGVPVAIIEAQAMGIPCLLSDRVSEEVRVNDNIDFLSLEANIEIWSEEAHKLIGLERKNQQENIKKMGYDIRTSIYMNEKLYV